MKIWQDRKAKKGLRELTVFGLAALRGASLLGPRFFLAFRL
jgi:hypothetical protein